MSQLTATREHCATCFAALDAALSGRDPPPPPPSLSGQRAALFVTWTTTRTDGLRGCIGNLSEIPVASGLVDYALRAARDSRFEPISKDELPQLTCAVSLLGGFEQASAWNDWEVGKHGIVLKLQTGLVSYSATYLPEVAEEQGWDHVAAVKSLLAKAGMAKRDITDAVLPNVRITRYTSSKCALSYDEWRAMTTQRR